MDILFFLNLIEAGLLIYAKGNAANLALAESGSEAQAAENDQNSKYNIQQIGIESFSNEYEEDLIDEWIELFKKTTNFYANISVWTFR